VAFNFALRDFAFNYRLADDKIIRLLIYKKYGIARKN
jgi:hypothetical protein